MRTFIKNYIDAKKRQKLEETGEEGFSLIELIIVVVILGILVAVAIPIFANIQTTAQENALKAAAANGATAAASVIANSTTAAPATATTVNAGAQSAGSADISVASTGGITIDTLCVTATGFGKKVSAGTSSAATCVKTVTAAGP
jgi:type IV pilus assembly protein PilA